MNLLSRTLALATLSVTAPLLAASASVLTAGAASAATSTCLGSEATIVSTEGTTVRGTPSDDVIVVSRSGEQRLGSLTVTSGNGDDKICLVGRAVITGNASLSAGQGDDRILNETVFHSPGKGHVNVVVDLGYGLDRYRSIGQGTHDIVDAGRGRDIVSTGTGPDFVRTGVGGTFTSAPVGEANNDSIKLGGGADELYLEALDNSQADLRGDNGIDTLSFYPEGTVVRADLLERTMRIAFPDPDDTRPDLQWPILGFDSLSLHASKVRVEGDEGRNHFDIQACDTVVNAGGGDDLVHIRARSFDSGRVSTRYPVDCAKGAKAYGQAGNDRLLGDGDRETLIGGPGRDVADGRGDVDTCQAETETRCERNP